MRSVWIRRALFTVVGVAVFVTPITRELSGSVRDIFVMASGIALVSAGWVHPLSTNVFSYLVVSLLMMMIGTFSLLVTTGGTMAIVLLVVASRVRRTSQVPTSSLRLIEPNAIMPRAVATRDELARLGFATVGAYAANAGGHDIIISVMLAPDRRSFASFTDATMTITSMFDGSHALQTATSAMVPSPPWVIENPQVGADPVELLDSHDKALTIVAERNATPLALEPGTVATLALRNELQQVLWLDANPFRLTPLELQEPLWHRLGRYQEIEDWLAAEPPPEDPDLLDPVTDG